MVSTGRGGIGSPTATVAERGCAGRTVRVEVSPTLDPHPARSSATAGRTTRFTVLTTSAAREWVPRELLRNRLDSTRRTRRYTDATSGRRASLERGARSRSVRTARISRAIASALWPSSDAPMLIGHAVVASTAAGRGPRLLALVWRACQRPARPDGGEVPRAATGRSPEL